jgi:hypothetical protein
MVRPGHPKEVNPLSHRIKPVLSTLAVTAAVAGGGAAIANAATSTTAHSTSSSSSSTPAQTSTSSRANTAPGAPMPGSHARGGGHNCPGM